jgi:short chain dehydrogenase
MGKLDGKVAVITGATSGMALASAKLFVEEGAHVFITGRRQDSLDNAIKAIGRNVTGVQGDSAKLADLDRLYETVKREKGCIDVMFCQRRSWRSRAAGGDHRRAVRQHLFPEYPRNTLHRAEGASHDPEWRIDHHERFDRSPQGYARARRLCGKQGSAAIVRAIMGGRTRRAQDSRQRAQPGTDRYQRSRERPCGSKGVLLVSHSSQGVRTLGRDRDDGAVSRLRRLQLCERQRDLC